MNEIVKMFLLTCDKFIPKKPGFIESAWGLSTEKLERIQNVKETGDSRYTYLNTLVEACFQDDMAYRDWKDLARRTDSDKTWINGL